MKEVVLTVGIIVLGILSSLVVSLRASAPQAQNPNSPQLEPTSLVADAPPSDDRGTPGQRS